MFDPGDRTDAIFLISQKALALCPFSSTKQTSIIIPWLCSPELYQCFSTTQKAGSFCRWLCCCVITITLWSVLGPLLFLICINDLLQSLSCSICLSPDDHIVYHQMEPNIDTECIQNDLHTISQWCKTWLTLLNVSKYIVTSSPHCGSCPHTYLLNTHCHAWATWDPYQGYLAEALTSVQARATQFITSSYPRDSSISHTKNNLGIDLLTSKRSMARLCRFHKTYHNRSAHDRCLVSAKCISPHCDHTRKMKLPRCNTIIFLKSFFPKSDWNQ